MCQATKSGRPLVSIVILNWNGAGKLEKCLQSLMRLDYENHEIIVVDNGSSDGSPDVVARDYKAVKLIMNGRNLGFARGTNIGIRSSRGDLIVLLNNDVVVDESWLSELVRTAVEPASTGMTSGIVMQAAPTDVVWSAGNKIDAFTGSRWRIDFGAKFRHSTEEQDIDYFSACALLVRRELVLRIGPLDEGFFFYGEDADWALRARRAGNPCRLVASAVVWHEGSATIRHVKQKDYWYHLATFRLVFKHFPLRYMFTALFSQLILLSVADILLLRRSPDEVLLRLRAFARTIVNLRQTILQRQAVHRLGELSMKPRLKELVNLARIRVTTSNG